MKNDLKENIQYTSVKTKLNPQIGTLGKYLEKKNRNKHLLFSQNQSLVGVTSLYLLFIKVMIVILRPQNTKIN